jgi:RND family efflux transporter MFP subunit
VPAVIIGVVCIGAVCAQDSGNQQIAKDTARSNQRDSIVGFVQPSKQVLVATPLGGIVVKVLVDEGDRVEAGDSIAKMDDGIQMAQLEISRLEVEQQQVILDEAELEHEKVLRLFKENVMNDWEVRSASVTLEGAKIALRYAKTKVNRDQVMLDRYKLNAPFAGQVIKVAVEEGETVEQGQDLLLLVSMETLEAHVSAPIDLYGKLKIGKDYHLVADLPDGVEGLKADKILDARLKFVEPNINIASRTFQCVFTIKNPGKNLPFGFRVWLRRPQ